MTRAASLLLRVVGLALVLVAATGFLLLGDRGAWTARASVPAGRTAVLVEPAVASVLGPSVSVRVEPNDDVDEAAYFLGRGRSDDLAAYVQGSDVVRIVGFDGSRRLALQPGPPPVTASTPSATPSPTPSATPSPAPSATPSPTPSPTTASPARWQPPMTVDLWQQQVTGPQASELSWQPSPGARSILVAHEDGSALPALDITVTWQDGRWLWYPVAALVLGSAMIVGGFVLVGALSFGALRDRGARTWSALTSNGSMRRLSARRTRSAPPSASTSADDVGAVTDAGADVPAQRATAMRDEPVTVPTAAAGENQRQPVGDVLPTRRMTRGRRRKETAWQRARAKARSRAGGSR